MVSNEGTVHMIVIGADTHKRSHTLVAVDAATGRTRGELEIAASDAGRARRAAVRGRPGRRAGVGDRGLPACVRAPGAHAGGRR